MNNIYDFNLGSLVQILDYRKFDLMNIETDLKSHSLKLRVKFNDSGTELEKLKVTLGEFNLEVINAKDIVDDDKEEFGCPYLYTDITCKSTVRYRIFSKELYISNGSIHGENKSVSTK